MNPSPIDPTRGAPDSRDPRSQRNQRWAPGELRLEQTLWRARLALFWERLWPRLAPAATVAALFAALVLFDAFPVLPFWIHVAALALFALLFLAALVRAPLGLRWPTSAEGRRRVEVASELRHRPLETLNEPIAVGADDPQTRALWTAHQARAKAALDALRSGLAAPGLARLDPYAIRFAVLLLLAVGVAVGMGDGDKRFARALDPLTALTKSEPVHIGAWITPPGYTGLPPIVLAFGDKTKDDAARKGAKVRAPAPITVPEGSSLLVEVDGGTRVPTLRVGNDKQSLESVGERAFRAETLIGSGSSITVERRGSKLAEWPINVVSDQEPTVKFTEPPAPNERGQIKLAIEAQDDYGIASLVAYVRFAERGVDDPPMEIQLPLPGDRKNFKQTTFQDLTSSPWAGLDVTIQVMARDGVDQVGVTEAVPLTLPERVFRNPLARALVALRKELVRNPAARAPARNALDGLLRTPDKLPDDSVVRLALSAAAGRLRYDASRKGTLAVAQLLWETALRLEDGAVAAAQRELTSKQRELMDRLNDKTGDAEIDKLFDEVREALAKALQEAMKNMANMPPWDMPLPPDAQVMSADDLFRQLEEARDLAKSGSRDAARERLQQMLSMLDALRNGGMAQMSPQQMEQMKQANEMSKKLQDLARRQKELMDQTFQRSQRGQRGQNGQQSQDQNGTAEQQDQLRSELDDLMQQLGEMMGQVPGNLGEAEKAMRESSNALGQGNPGAALDPQGRALQALQQGQGQMSQMMAQAMGLRGFMPGGTQTPRAGDGRNTDPFGRPLPAVGSSNGDEVKIPDASERARAREILDELRRRSAEPDRPRIEHDYIERLLRRF
ncbi:MAG TPA: DUF4175 family protein [Alphaproteobacteria bacterium]|jgi:uncharacterized protein (TIGR02302 family)|nr:DUF4175 family protein [Alphaproteobacteria bacterium]